MQTEMIVIAVLTILVVAGYIFVPYLMSKNATAEVIDRFCRYKAVEEGRARTDAELGLNPPDLYKRLTSTRDYKPLVLRSLINAGIVNSSEDGKLYLVEENIREEFRCKR